METSSPASGIADTKVVPVISGTQPVRVTTYSADGTTVNYTVDALGNTQPARTSGPIDLTSEGSPAGWHASLQTASYVMADSGAIGGIGAIGKAKGEWDLILARASDAIGRGVLRLTESEGGGPPTNWLPYGLANKLEKRTPGAFIQRTAEAYLNHLSMGSEDVFSPDLQRDVVKAAKTLMEERENIPSDPEFMKLTAGLADYISNAKLTNYMANVDANAPALNGIAPSAVERMGQEILRAYGALRNGPDKYLQYMNEGGFSEIMSNPLNQALTRAGAFDSKELRELAVVQEFLKNPMYVPNNTTTNSVNTPTTTFAVQVATTKIPAPAPGPGS